MPLYEVNHSCALGHRERTKLAEQITNLHCRTFNAPSMFVNVMFKGPVSKPSMNALQSSKSPAPKHLNNALQPASVEHDENEVAFFVGGREAHPNTITARLRPRPNKHPDTLNTLIRDMTTIWNSIIRVKSSHYTPLEPQGRLDDPRALHRIFVHEVIAAGSEQGFVLPAAGNDGQWLEQQIPEFERRTKAGDRDMERMLLEVRKGVGSGFVRDEDVRKSHDVSRGREAKKSHDLKREKSRDARKEKSRDAKGEVQVRPSHDIKRDASSNGVVEIKEQPKRSDERKKGNGDGNGYLSVDGHGDESKPKSIKKKVSKLFDNLG